MLAGGTGGAKLARGMADVVDPERLTVVVNTGDDIQIYGAYVSPDPDLVSFWLAGEIDERGWGLRDDSFAVMDALRALGVDVWFNLGDRDLAWCIERARMLAAGLTATTGAGAARSASPIPGTARIGAIDASGFDGPITIAPAQAIASSTASLGRADSAPRNSSPSTGPAARSRIMNS